MAGHSKWANTKRRKALVDSKRGKLFTKLLREIQVAAKMGGGNADGNPRLKAAISAAKSVSVPSDNIDRAIKRGAGELEDVNYEEILYEGYGPGGVAILVKALTDNRNRTAADIRHTFSRNGGSLGGTNSVAYIFSEKGVFRIPISVITEEALLNIVLEVGADDVSSDTECWIVTAPIKEAEGVRESLEKAKLNFEFELSMIPNTTVTVSKEVEESLGKLLEALEDMDDVQTAYLNTLE